MNNHIDYYTIIGLYNAIFINNNGKFSISCHLEFGNGARVFSECIMSEQRTFLVLNNNIKIQVPN